jgi:hypothetical protein
MEGMSAPSARKIYMDHVVFPMVIIQQSPAKIDAFLAPATGKQSFQ